MTVLVYSICQSVVMTIETTSHPAMLDARKEPHMYEDSFISSIFYQFLYLGLFEPVHEKTNNLGSDQVRHKPGCTFTEDG